MHRLDRNLVRKASPLEEVIPWLTGEPIRGQGVERRTRCLFHQPDTHPSLRLHVEKQVWRCDVCAFGGDVFDLVQRHVGGDFKDAMKFLADRAGITTVTGGGVTNEVTATYDYHDAKENLLFQVCRFTSASGKKTFRQRRPDGHGGWIPNLDGVSRVLYRLPELLRADPSMPVYIAEGEKDVDNLVALGLVATCNPGGAGNWKSGFSDVIRGRTVIILADNDEPGRRHAEQIARSLVEVHS